MEEVIKDTINIGKRSSATIFLDLKIWLLAILKSLDYDIVLVDTFSIIIFKVALYYQAKYSASFNMQLADSYCVKIRGVGEDEIVVGPLI